MTVCRPQSGSLSRLRERVGVRACARRLPTLTPALSRLAGEGEMQS